MIGLCGNVGGYSTNFCLTSLIDPHTCLLLVFPFLQVAWAVSIAPDTIKSTIQTAEQPLGLVQTTKQIVQARGISALFKGMT